MTSLRERKKLQTRDAIIEAALTLFERDGYDGTTLEDVAEAANVSPRTLLRYFDTKAALVLDWSRPANDDRGLDLIIARPASEAPMDAALHVLRAKLAAALAGGDETRVLRQLRIVMSNPALESLAAARFRDRRSGIARAIAGRLSLPEDSLAVQVQASAFAETAWATLEHWVRRGGALDDLDAVLTEAFEHLRAGVSGLPASGD